MSEGHSDLAKFLWELNQSNIDRNQIIFESREYCW